MPPVARVGDVALCAADTHLVPPGIGIPTPFPVTGPIVQGSARLMVSGMPAARKGDKGVHLACPDVNQYSVDAGSSRWFDSNKAVARAGDATKHCGNPGQGSILLGAFTVIDH